MFNRDEAVICIQDFPAGACWDETEWFPYVGGIYHCAGMDGQFIELAEDPDAFNPLFGWFSSYFRKLKANESEARSTWQEMLKNPQRVDA